MKQSKISWHIQIIGVAITLTSTFLLSSCQKDNNKSSHSTKFLQPIVHNELTNYGEPNLKRLAMHLNDPSARTHIVQIGDSHTAADFFSGTLRDKFQKRYGNAGIGFVPPSIIAGQRTANFVFSEPKKQWSFLTSRKESAPNFPLGGFIISPTTLHSTLLMKERTPSSSQYDMRVLYQTAYPNTLQINNKLLNLPPSSEWRFSDSMPVIFPTNITASEQKPLNIGGWLITRNHPGVMLSAIGINGATIAMTEKWQPQWVHTLAETHPDLVILAYGTNEAFNDSLDLDIYRQQLTNVVQRIRHDMPHAVILLVGPGDSIKNKNALDCRSQQPSNLHNVIQIQRAIAKKESLLYWDWQQFMGGDCSINNWVNRGLARTDKVHLSVQGYSSSANALYRSLASLLAQQ